MRIVVAGAIVATAGTAVHGAHADAVEPAPRATIQLVALAPPAADDARRAIAIGRDGEVYEPDGNGGWVHRLASSTATPVVAAGRAGDAIVAIGDGVIYRLAGNGWSAIRLVQRGKATLGHGTRSLAAVGRQLFSLEQLTRGESTRLVQAPSNIVAIGASARSIVVATETGVLRVVGGKLVPIRSVPARPHLLSDRWALVDRGAFDLTTGKLTAWPAGLTIGAATATPDDALAAIATSRTGLELLTLRAGKLARDPLGITGTAVGVAIDRAGRAVVALSDGRIAIRSKTGWTTTTAIDDPPAEHPGPAPATSE